tara:strand:- start:1486 stop:1734 length:249 start_codon:yes stop_codon:yes gene_type:complete
MKIKKEQLTKIQEQQTKLNDLLNKIGVLEANKHGLLHEMAGLNQDIEKFKKELEKEYGAVNINIEDGSYSKIEQEDIPVAAI